MSSIELPYEDIKLKDGRQTYQCKASEECRAKNICYEKWEEIMDHLVSVHNINYVALLQKFGQPQPLGSHHKGRTPRSTKYEKQSQARIDNPKYKFERNKKNHEKNQMKEVLKKQNALSDFEKYSKGPKDVFLEKDVTNAMEECVRTKPQGMVAIQKPIDKGYESQKQLALKREKPQELEKTLLTTNSECGDLLSPTKQVKRRRYGEDSLEKSDLAIEKDEASHTIPKCKSKKMGLSMVSKSHETTSDAPLMDNITSPTLVISNNEIYLDSSTINEKDKKFIRQRFESGLSIHFQSQRSTLISEVDIKLLNDIMKAKASTRTMNLFMLYLESTLPREALDKVWFFDSLWFEFLKRHLNEDSRRVKNYFGDIDMSKYLFLFLPIVERDHWVLFVMYNNHMQKPVSLPWDEHGVIYFNSLSRSNSQHYLPIVYRALQIISQNCSNVHLKEFMKSPRKTLAPLEIPEVPLQPNVIDCGYYVMSYIKHLIHDAFGERPKIWLTRTWFKHQDVLMLKRELHKWTKSALDVVKK